MQNKFITISYIIYFFLLSLVFCNFLFKIIQTKCYFISLVRISNVFAYSRKSNSILDIPPPHWSKREKKSKNLAIWSL